jgi:hypothetical protein
MFFKGINNNISSLMHKVQNYSIQLRGGIPDFVSLRRVKR